MKKFMLSAILAIATISGVYGYFNQPSTPQLNELGVANVEALSYDEWGFDDGCDGAGDGCIMWPSVWHPDLRGIDYPM